MSFQVYVIVKKSDSKCDECGVEITAKTAFLVEDAGDTVPVCKCCKDKF